MQTYGLKPVPSKLIHYRQVLTTSRARVGHKCAHLVGVFSAWFRFDSAGDVDAPWAQRGDGFRNVQWSESAGSDAWASIRVLKKGLASGEPVEGDTSAAHGRGCARVDQDRIYIRVRVEGCGAFGRMGVKMDHA
jgi:hypothetical protein